MIFTISDDLHEHCLELCTGSQFNKTTMLDNGSGQYVGNIAELIFARFLIICGLDFSMVGSSVFDYDFEVCGLTFDIKAKKRSVKPQPHYNAHVNDSQKHLDVNYYVFASVLCNKDRAIECELLGYIQKREFWDKSARMAKGDNDTAFFKSRADGHTLQYKNLRSMQDLGNNLRNIKGQVI